jgi:hypothetical protein
MPKKQNHHTPHRQARPTGDDTSTETPSQRKAYQLFMVFAGITLIHYYLQPNLFGHDARYTIYILWLPIIGGIAIIAYWQRKFLLDDFRHEKKFWDAFVMGILYFLGGLIFSFMSFAQLVGAGFDAANYSAAKHAHPMVIECPVDRFFVGRGHDITHYEADFTLNNHPEYITMDWQDFKQYDIKNPRKYKLKLTMRKGIWNFYLLDNWDIVTR